MNKRMLELAGVNKKISYSSVVLDEESKNKILNIVGKEIPEGWEIVNHHSTINLGELDPKYNYKVGEEVLMNISGLGISDKSIAVKTDIRCMNVHPHITVAIDRKGGAKPIDSNKIKNWKPIEPFQVKGIVKEL